MLWGDISCITFMILRGEGIIYSSLIFTILHFIVQMGSKCSPRVSGLRYLLARLDGLASFHVDSTQMKVEGFDAQFWVINFYTITIGSYIPVCA